MTSRRDLLKGGAVLAGATALFAHGLAAEEMNDGGAMKMPMGNKRAATVTTAKAPSARTEAPLAPPEGVRYTPVITPNNGSLPWRMKDGVKEFRLIAQPVKREFAPGMVVNAWGYNGRTPGPTIEAVEGDRVRILVENRLPEGTTVHWHGVIVPNAMDGVGGLTQPYIPPGRTMVYEFDLLEPGTYMYHPHADETLQMGLGLMGFFIVHPKDPEQHKGIVISRSCSMPGMSIRVQRRRSGRP